MRADASGGRLDDSHLDAAREVLVSQFGGDPPKLAVVTGSLAAGLGHAWSDVDVYVVDEHGTLEARGHRVGGYTVQITPVSRSALDAVLRAAEGFTATSSDRSTLGVDDEFVTLAVRMVIGHVLHDAEQVLPDREQARTALRQLVLARHAIQVGSLAEDVLGALESEDVWLGVRASVLALEHAVDAHLAASGDLYTGSKFLYRRLVRTCGDPATARAYLDLLTVEEAEFELEAPLDRAVVRTRAASRLMAAALLGGYDAPAAHWPAPPPADHLGPITSPWFCPARYVDGWGIAGPDRGFRVSEELVRIWLSADGSTLESAHASLQSTDARFADLSLGAYREAIERLTSIGSVSAAGTLPERMRG